VQSAAVRGIDPVAKGQLWQRHTLRPGHATSTLTPVQERSRFTVAGVSWARSTELSGADVIVQVRVREDSGWTGWETPGVTDEGPQGGTAESATARLGTNPLVTDGATAIQVRVDTTNGRPLPDVRVTTINPGTSAADDNLINHAPAASASAAALTPTIITRKQWGADESLRGSTTLNATVKAITIHHTASSNDYTAATAAAQIRGIYAYDTKGLGWSHIAYNFLVDKFGRVYEGRAGSITQAVRGAHAMGFNTNTMGVAALGNYETTPAPAVMVDSLAKVAGWKLSQYGVDPTATTTLTSAGGTGAKFAAGVVATLSTINAHRDSSYTACPGKNLFPMMATIRSKAALYAKYSSTTGPAPVTTANLFAAYGTVTLASGSTGWAVRDLQLELNRRGFAAGTADGAFGATSLGAVQRFQKAVLLSVTGKVAANDWRALSGLSYTKTGAPPPPPAPAPVPVPAKAIVGFNADGRGDVIGRTTPGDLYFYPAKVGGIGTPVRISGGWNAFRQVVSPGDLSGDGIADVLAITSTGSAYLYKGNGKGGLLAGRTLLSQAWMDYTDVLTPGDWTGDGKPDLLARKSNGELWLVAGNGKGGFTGTWRRIGAGWQMFSQMITPGDVTGDGRVDLLGRTPAGKLYLYKGTGVATAAGCLPGVLVSSGWQMFNTVLSTGDLTGDGKADLIGRTPANVDYVYAGTGKGSFAAAKRFSAPWGATTRITGVR
jgi:peptidoglycan hydrolase-like protein with peptidoglycan-binding domain